MHFADFFRLATGGYAPYPYQERLAGAAFLPTLLEVPTGFGKTAAAVLTWLWRRRFAEVAVRQGTPRRLVYCLPMRSLVEQTQKNCQRWRDNVGLSPDELSIHALMGGEDGGDWDGHPERDAILVGTQDMLLSRALNRGYGMSRYRWPVHFALVSNDCLWVLDETQLMGVGVTTSAQLQGLRKTLGVFGTAQTLWMSATLGHDQLATIDHPRPAAGWRPHMLTDRDRATPAAKKLLTAQKPLGKSRVTLTADTAKRESAGYAAELATEVIKAHRPGTLTLVVVNRVDRARQLRKQLGSGNPPAELFLIHSRFRQTERKTIQAAALAEDTIDPTGPGRIVVATQAIEAGVDVSATTMIFELAPWSCCVQRLGRCNRRGACGRDGHPPAKALWIDFDTSDISKAAELSLPYSPAELDAARDHLLDLVDGGNEALAKVHHIEALAVVHTLRRKDLLELFDTSPDLAGNDLDVSRFIRDANTMDIQFYWRAWDAKATPDGRPPAGDDAAQAFPAAQRDELCAVSIAAARDFLGMLKKTKAASAWRWNPLTREWQPVQAASIFPGMTILLPLAAGGYDTALGWTGNPKDIGFEPAPLPSAIAAAAEESIDDDETSGAGLPVLLSKHLSDVASAATDLRARLEPAFPDIPWKSLVRAAWWHDVGKAHEAFQTAMSDCEAVRLLNAVPQQLWAKSGQQKRSRYRVGNQDRRGFRHELASGLAWLCTAPAEPDGDLIAFLIAAHHGKVRVSIRSLPNEHRPAASAARFSRGIWEGDELPKLALGNGEISLPFVVNLELMELGGSPDSAAASWTARILALRDSPALGPFRLAFLETLLRVADWRGSSQTVKA